MNACTCSLPRFILSADIFFARQIRLAKPFQGGTIARACKYNSKRDDHGAGKERKMSYPVKNLKLDIKLFSTCPRESVTPKECSVNFYYYQKITVVMKSIKIIWLLFFSLMHHNTCWYGLLIVKLNISNFYHPTLCVTARSK